MVSRENCIFTLNRKTVKLPLGFSHLRSFIFTKVFLFVFFLLFIFFLLSSQVVYPAKRKIIRSLCAIFATSSTIFMSHIYITSKSWRGGAPPPPMSHLLLFFLLKKSMFHCKFTYNYANTFRIFRDAYCVKGRQADRPTDTLTDILFFFQRSLE